MVARQTPDIDVQPTDPAVTAHAFANALAGRRVHLERATTIVTENDSSPNARHEESQVLEGSVQCSTTCHHS